MVLGYAHGTKDFVVVQDENDDWVAANSLPDGSFSAPIAKLAAGNCPQGTFLINSKSIKVDFEQGDAKNCDGIITPTMPTSTTTSAPGKYLVTIKN